MSAQPAPAKGQVWISRDRRDRGKRVTVIAVWPSHNLVTVSGPVRASTMKTLTLRTRYRIEDFRPAAREQDGSGGPGSPVLGPPTTHQ